MKNLIGEISFTWPERFSSLFQSRVSTCNSTNRCSRNRTSIKIGEFTCNLSHTFISFRCFETKSNLQETRQVEEYQRLAIFSPITGAKTLEIQRTDTSPMEKRTIFHSARPGFSIMETKRQSVGVVTRKNVDLAKYGHSSD